MRRGLFHRTGVATEERKLTHWGAMVLVFIGILMLLNQISPGLLQGPRARIMGLLLPIYNLLSEPVHYVHNGYNTLEEWTDLYHENHRLRVENARLQAEVNAHRPLKTQNEHFRQLLNRPHDLGGNYITARIVATSGGGYVKSLVLDRGAEHGVHEGAVALFNGAYVGMAVEVYPRATRILLPNDLSSSIPVYIDKTGIHALVKGDNRLRPLLSYLSQPGAAQDGRFVLTSGLGGLLPRDLLVGQIAIEDDGQPRVRLATDSSNLHYVQFFVPSSQGLVARPDRVHEPR